MLGDPFNYPTLNRSHLMSLSSIGSMDSKKLTTKSFTSNRQVSMNLDTRDIEGASPKIHGSHVPHKQEYSLNNWDIDRAFPRALHVGLHKPETNLTNKDIEGSSPRCVKFQSSRYNHNPLDPVYQISKVEIRPVTPPKFIRDQMDVSDIEKAQPKKDYHNAMATKPIMRISDIEGSSARERTYQRPRDPGFSTIEYSDVTKKM
jgi:hypothetical protein